MSISEERYISPRRLKDFKTLLDEEIDSKANEIEITTTNVTPTDENVEMWVNLGQKQTIYIPETAEDISYDN